MWEKKAQNISYVQQVHNLMSFVQLDINCLIDRLSFDQILLK